MVLVILRVLLAVLRPRMLHARGCGADPSPVSAPNSPVYRSRYESAVSKESWRTYFHRLQKSFIWRLLSIPSLSQTHIGHKVLTHIYLAALHILRAAPWQLSFQSTIQHQARHHYHIMSPVLPRHDIEFPTLDGITLRGWLYPATKRGPGMILSPGFNMPKDAIIPDICKWFQERDITCLAWDPRGIGASDGEPRNDVSSSRDVNFSIQK